MNEEVKQATKKYLLMVPQTLWDDLVAFQKIYNDDPKNIGQASCNRLLEMAIRQFLAANAKVEAA